MKSSEREYILGSHQERGFFFDCSILKQMKTSGAETAVHHATIGHTWYSNATAKHVVRLGRLYDI
jgi:hypothetical protein